MSSLPHIESLVALGMTPLEAAVYEHLVQHPSATGYRISRGIDKPTANTYKALASLEEKGAVVVDDDRRRLYCAVPPDELLGTLERRFMEHRRSAAAGLAGLADTRGDNRIYQLRTTEQIVERLRRMVARTREVAVFDLSPWAVERVSEDLELAAGGGARVVVRVYDTDIAGVQCVRGEDDTANPAAHTANAVVDGKEMLLAALDPDGAAVHRALWTVHRDVVRVVHRAIVAELMFAEIERGLAEGLSTDALEETFEDYRRLRDRAATVE
jgi:sugar-specific transcriptional regulator TrmB